MRRITYIALLIIGCQYIYAQQQYAIEILRGSVFYINGYTNVTPFTISQEIGEITGKTLTADICKSERSVQMLQRKFLVPVEKFQSNNPMALRDFKKLVQSDKFPNFQLLVEDLNSISGSLTHNNLGRVKVSLSIAGKTNTYEIDITGRIHTNKIAIKAKKRISIRDFNLEPPVTLFGMIRVSEWIDLELIANLNYQPVLSSKLSSL